MILTLKNKTKNFHAMNPNLPTQELLTLENPE